MAEELQGLLNRIQEEGLKKADEQKEKIIAEAKAEAAKIVKQAEAEAAQLKKSAEAEAESSMERAKAAVQQAARDIVIGLKSSLEARIKRLVSEAGSAALTPEFMGKVILEMVACQKDSASANAGLDVMVSAQNLLDMEALVRGSLADSLKRDVEVVPGNDLAAGLKVSFDGSDVYMDCSEEAITDLIVSYVGPRMAELLK